MPSFGHGMLAHWALDPGVLYLNLFAGCYLLSRRLFLKETGRKLAHLERQLQSGDSIVRDLSERLAAEE